MAEPLLLLSGAAQLSAAQIDLLRQDGWQVLVLPRESDPMPDGGYQAEAIVGNRILDHHPLDRFTQLRIVQLTSAGIDQVSPEQLAARGIALYNAKDVYSIPIAEWVVLKILELYKNSLAFQRQQQQQLWQKQRQLLELAGRNALILGFGSIGQAVAQRLQAFGVTVTAAGRRTEKPSGCDAYVQLNEVDSVLPTCDLVICALPASPQTHHFLNHERLSRLPDHAVLVNVSRGSIIDETALLGLLAEGKFRGVALDVFETEPLPSGHPFWTIDRVLVTPHNSFLSDRNIECLFARIRANLAQRIGPLT